MRLEQNASCQCCFRLLFFCYSNRQVCAHSCSTVTVSFWVTLTPMLLLSLYRFSKCSVTSGYTLTPRLFLALHCYSSNRKLLTLDCNGELLGHVDPQAVPGVTLVDPLLVALGVGQQQQSTGRHLLTAPDTGQRHGHGQNKALPKPGHTSSYTQL